MSHSFTDIHHHLLYGIDDGPGTREKMNAMLDRAAQDGITQLIATPHVVPGVKRFDAEKYNLAFEQACAYCKSESLGITLHQGAEVLYTEFTERFIHEGRVPTLAGSDYLLVEFSPDIARQQLQDALESLLHAGVIPVVAHVERYRCMVLQPAWAEKMREQLNVLYQVNCATLVYGYGMLNDRFVDRLMKKEMIDAVATDAHNTSSRRAVMTKCWRRLREFYGESYARRLTNGSLFRTY